MTVRAPLPDELPLLQAIGVAAGRRFAEVGLDAVGAVASILDAGQGNHRGDRNVVIGVRDVVGEGRDQPAVLL